MILLLPVCCRADGASDYIGTWVQCNDDDGSLLYVLLHFREDGVVFYSTVLLSDDDEGGDRAFVRNHVGEWHLTSDGVHAQTGFNTSMDLFIVEPGVLGEQLTGAYSPYYRVRGDQAAVSGSGTAVEQGAYLVGRDIPAGVYRLEMIDNHSADLYVYKDQEASFYSSFALISRTTPSCARFELQDGQVVRIQMGPVLFTKPTGMNFDWINND